MFGLAAGKIRVGQALGQSCAQTEGCVTFVEILLATAVLNGLALRAGLHAGGLIRWPGS
jgi:hypothetical protein